MDDTSQFFDGGLSHSDHPHHTAKFHAGETHSDPRSTSPPALTAAEPARLARMRLLSPRRKTTEAVEATGLVEEQLVHFGIEPSKPFGQAACSSGGAALRMSNRH